MRTRIHRLGSDSTEGDPLKKCGECGAKVGPKEWMHYTNGDGATVQKCPKCGTCFSLGRYFQDASLGVRLPAESLWSALVTLKVRPT